MKISRWYMAISTAACVMLFTIGALTMLESQNYFMAALFLFLVFAAPLQHEYMRDDVLKPESGIGRDAANAQETDAERRSIDRSR